MSFNRNIQVDPNRVSTRSGGHRGAAVGGGSVLVVLAVVLLSQVTGVDLTGLLGESTQGTTTSTSSTIDMSMCTDGDAANTHTQCRMAATAESLDAVWGSQLPSQTGTAYVQPDFVLWDGSAVSTACGTASSAVGPFYCSGDTTVYLDMSFFNQMESQLGATDTPLAEEYIVAHEFGHHIQNVLGTMSQADRSGTGATSDSVRLELQADCYAGIWVHDAANTPDPETGQAFLVTPTQEEIRSAIDAAASVGDDRIQEKTTGGVDPDSWTHGSADQRVKWFTTGMTTGSVDQCNTFGVGAEDL